MNEKEINCNFCNKPIKIYKKRKNIIVLNIEQNPAILYFCSIRCKSNWIYQVQERQNWNRLEKEYFQETGKLPYPEENEYEKWLNERLKQLKRTFKQIKKV